MMGTHALNSRGGSQMCQECDRLWRELADAMQADLTIADHLQKAALLGPSDAITALRANRCEASARRAKAFAAVKTHELRHSRGLTIGATGG
jgi:hypothetical protein